MEDAKISTESLVTERLRVTLAETEAERDELRAKYRELQCQQDESHYQRALRLEKQLADAERRAEEAVELVHQQANEQLAKLTERAEKLERLLNESVAEYDRRGLRLSEAQAQNAELQRSERTLAQQRDRAHENLARVTAMNAELRRALEGLAADVRRWNTQDPMPDMSGKHRGWRYPQLEIFVERALASGGSASECLSCGRPLAWDGKKYSHADESHDHEPVASDGSAAGEVPEFTSKTGVDAKANNSAAGDVLAAAEDFAFAMWDEGKRFAVKRAVMKWREERGDG